MFVLSWISAAARLIPSWMYLAGLAVAGIGFLWQYNATLRCRAELGEFKGAYTILAASVVRQNDAVNAWEAQATEAQGRAEQAMKAAAEANAKERVIIKRERSYIGIPTPIEIPVESRCEAGQDVVRKGMTE